MPSPQRRAWRRRSAPSNSNSAAYCHRALVSRCLCPSPLSQDFDTLSRRASSRRRAPQASGAELIAPPVSTAARSSPGHHGPLCCATSRRGDNFNRATSGAFRLPLSVAGAAWPQVGQPPLLGPPINLDAADQQQASEHCMKMDRRIMSDMGRPVTCRAACKAPHRAGLRVRVAHFLHASR